MADKSLKRLMEACVYMICRKALACSKSWRGRCLLLADVVRGCDTIEKMIGGRALHCKIYQWVGFSITISGLGLIIAGLDWMSK
jgi:hypothetical protein